MVGRANASNTRGDTSEGPGPIRVLLGGIKDGTVKFFLLMNILKLINKPNSSFQTMKGYMLVL